MVNTFKVIPDQNVAKWPQMIISSDIAANRNLKWFKMVKLFKFVPDQKVPQLPQIAVSSDIAAQIGIQFDQNGENVVPDQKSFRMASDIHIK